MRTLLLIASLLAFVPAARAEEPWPQFRGPTGQGHAGAAAIPLTWSEKQNIRWKTPIHDRGHSSLVTWGSQVWLTTAAKDGHRMYAVCTDLASGRIVHDLKVFDVEKPEPIHDLNSYASPTPVIEEGRVYVHFGSYGTACLDTATGRPVWVRRDLKCDHFRGPGSSPFLLGNLLILHFDGIDVQYLVALDKATGRTVWRTDRSVDFSKVDPDLRKAYSTPILLEHAGQSQLISTGSFATMAYDPTNGRELWKVCYPGGYSNTSRPVTCGEFVLINTGFARPELWGVRLGGAGDITRSHVAWKFVKSVPAKPSPVVVDGLVFMASDGGIATCLDVKTGKAVWQERIGGSHSASALAASGRVYFWDQEGKSTVVAAGREFKSLAVNKLDDGCMATPAVSGRALILRSNTHLYRIEEQGAGSGE